jgi:hypothetical protein
MLSRKNEEETLHKEKDDPKSDHRRSVSENRKPQRPSTCPTKTPSNQKRSLLQTAYLTEPIAEALDTSAPSTLPAEVRKGPIGLGHLVHVVAFLDRAALPRSSVPQLVGEGFLHRNSLATFGKVDNPAHGQRDLPV